MTEAERGLVDTSVFIAAESGRALDVEALPQQWAVSVVTLAELQAGVLAAGDTTIRARRLATLDTLADAWVLAVDEQVAMQWARLRVGLAEEGRRMNVDDSWIAATAMAHELPIVTQDADFDPLEVLGAVRVLRV